jgi:hypothetical protein
LDISGSGTYIAAAAGWMIVVALPCTGIGILRVASASGTCFPGFFIAAFGIDFMHGFFLLWIKGS